LPASRPSPRRKPVASSAFPKTAKRPPKTRNSPHFGTASKPSAALRRLGVRHYFGGSVASTVHGAIRSTMGVDLVCSLSEVDPRARSAGAIAS
jgi:hypothetical protein